mgnify:FL=1|tara:strand:- start:6116 stop:6547 length:432 start_codon:yes stop_codon:yes gene_type:complete
MFNIIAAALNIAGVGLKAFATVEAGKAAEEAAERRAEEERIAAQNEELKRREELNRVLSSNILSQATSGIAAEGTPASITLEQAKTIGESESMIGLTNRLRQKNTIQSGREARKSANLQAASTLLRSADDVKTSFEEIKKELG